MKYTFIIMILLSASLIAKEKASFIKGAELWAQTCSRCHNMRDPQDYGDGQWKAILQHMRIRAGFTGGETNDILEFMQKSNDPIKRMSNTQKGEVSAKKEKVPAKEDEVPAKEDEVPAKKEKVHTKKDEVSAKKETVLPNLENGEKVYNTTCFACHGKNGKSLLPGVPSFRDKNSPLKTKSKDELIGNVIKGYQTKGSLLAMPPKGGNPDLKTKDIEDVVEYLMKKHK